MTYEAMYVSPTAKSACRAGFSLVPARIQKEFVKTFRTRLGHEYHNGRDGYVNASARLILYALRHKYGYFRLYSKLGEKSLAEESRICLGEAGCHHSRQTR